MIGGLRRVTARPPTGGAAGHAHVAQSLSANRTRSLGDGGSPSAAIGRERGKAGFDRRRGVSVNAPRLCAPAGARGGEYVRSRTAARGGVRGGGRCGRPAPMGRGGTAPPPRPGAARWRRAWGRGARPGPGGTIVNLPRLPRPAGSALGAMASHPEGVHPEADPHGPEQRPDRAAAAPLPLRKGWSGGGTGALKRAYGPYQRDSQTPKGWSLPVRAALPDTGTPEGRSSPRGTRGTAAPDEGNQQKEMRSGVQL